MNIALKHYVTELGRAGRNALRFFYYSGHGVANPETQIKQLIPVDVIDWGIPARTIVQMRLRLGIR